nr:interleukin [Hippocampus erectus]
MTARPLVTVRLITCGTAGTRLRLCPHLCRDRRTTQVWLCVFVLSFLSSTSSALSAQDSEDLQLCLRSLTPSIEESRAMLYAPSMNDIQAKCHLVSLKCYFLELVMVMDEEEVDGDNIYGNCLHDFNEALLPEGDALQVSCPPCEAHSLGNVTTFLDRLKTLLQAVTL